jgi:hypothetical protein
MTRAQSPVSRWLSIRAATPPRKPAVWPTPIGWIIPEPPLAGPGAAISGWIREALVVKLRRP